MTLWRVFVCRWQTLTPKLSPQDACRPGMSPEQLGCLLRNSLSKTVTSVHLLMFRRWNILHWIVNCCRCSLSSNYSLVIRTSSPWLPFQVVTTTGRKLEVFPQPVWKQTLSSKLTRRVLVDPCSEVKSWRRMFPALISVVYTHHARSVSLICTFLWRCYYPFFANWFFFEMWLLEKHGAEVAAT